MLVVLLPAKLPVRVQSQELPLPQHQAQMAVVQVAVLVHPLAFPLAVLVAQGRIGLQPQAARLALAVVAVVLPLVLLPLLVALAVLMAAVLVVAAQALPLRLLAAQVSLFSPTTHLRRTIRLLVTAAHMVSQVKPQMLVGVALQLLGRTHH